MSSVQPESTIIGVARPRVVDAANQREALPGIGASFGVGKAQVQDHEVRALFAASANACCGLERRDTSCPAASSSILRSSS